MSNVEQLKQIFSSVLEIPMTTVNENLTQDSVASWDSVAVVNLISEIEQVFGISFEITELLSFKSYPMVVEMLQEKGVQF